MKKYIIIAVGALALIGISVGASIFILGGQQPAPAAEGPVPDQPPPALETFYFAFKPEFIVNFPAQGRAQYFMAELSVSTQEEEVLDVLETHQPELRNDLLMLFGNQDANLVTSVEGKTRLREETLAAVQAVVEKHYGRAAINDVFFTRFVVQ